MTVQPEVLALLHLDRIVHEPARLTILTVLGSAHEADFKFLESVTGLNKGNLSSHLSKLEHAGYVNVTKTFRGRTPSTSYRITDAGQQALHAYWQRVRAALPEEDTSSG